MEFPGQTKFGAGVFFFRSFPISKGPKKSDFWELKELDNFFCPSASCSCPVVFVWWWIQWSHSKWPGSFSFLRSFRRVFFFFPHIFLVTGAKGLSVTSPSGACVFPKQGFPAESEWVKCEDRIPETQNYRNLRGAPLNATPSKTQDIAGLIFWDC